MNMKMFTFQKVGVNYVYCTVTFTIEKIGNTNDNDWIKTLTEFLPGKHRKGVILPHYIY